MVALLNESSDYAACSKVEQAKQKQEECRYGVNGSRRGLCLQMTKNGGPHHAALLRCLAKELKCEAGDIVDFELNVCDTQPGVIGGTCQQILTTSLSLWYYLASS